SQPLALADPTIPLIDRRPLPEPAGHRQLLRWYSSASIPKAGREASTVILHAIADLSSANCASLNFLADAQTAHSELPPESAFCQRRTRAQAFADRRN